MGGWVKIELDEVCWSDEVQSRMSVVRITCGMSCGGLKFEIK